MRYGDALMERRLRKLLKRIAKGQAVVDLTSGADFVVNESRGFAARVYARSLQPRPEIPHCEHGNILLGCPHDDCPQQNAYLDEIRVAMKDYEDRLWDLRREQQ